MLARAKEAGYRYANTNKTISDYTAGAVARFLPTDSIRDDQASGGRSSAAGDQGEQTSDVGNGRGIGESTAESDSAFSLSDRQQEVASEAQSVTIRALGKGGSIVEIEREANPELLREVSMMQGIYKQIIDCLTKSAQ
jgi:hypothetical protein